MDSNSLNLKQERKRKKIISAAFKLFVKHGIQGTSMKLLAKRADVSTGSIYNYFANKETLIQEIYKQAIKDESEYVLMDYDENASIRERFEHIVRHSVLFKVNNPDKFQFRRQYMHMSNVMNDIQDSVFLSSHPLCKVTTDAQKQGLCKPLDLEDILYFSGGLLFGFIGWKLSSDKEVTEAEIKNITELLWGAITVQSDKT